MSDAPRPPIIDAHVRLGTSRDVTLTVEALLASMADAGVDVSLVGPSEFQLAFDNAEGNRACAAAAAASAGRLLPYATVTPWQGTQRALDVLREARDDGAVALYVDPAIQGFDPFDGLIDPLITFALDSGWFVHIRSGTPPHATPLVIASVARRYPEGTFLMGRTGATDFWTDVAEAFRYAPNLYGETIYNAWDLALESMRIDPTVGSRRFVFGSDTPYATQRFELRRLGDWPTPPEEKAAVLGGTIAGWLGDRLQPPRH